MRKPNLPEGRDGKPAGLNIKVAGVAKGLRDLAG